ncbi:MAG: Rid family detoxifying hydrolase [Methanomassiliicoccales archaeon]|nr:Rid family detoxifying hydrolase [Methanomassiliicoccales archaeon]
MKRIVLSLEAPKPVGPYSQAVISDKFVFCSGQIGIDPFTGKLVQGGLEAETRQCLSNLEHVLTSIGLITRNVVKTTVFVTDLDDLKLINELYAQKFPKDPPARSIIEVRKLPLNAKIMIEAVAETY